MKLKGGIIGLGKMGISHAAIVSPHPSVEMVAVCDTSTIVMDVFRKFSMMKPASASDGCFGSGCG